MTQHVRTLQCILPPHLLEAVAERGTPAQRAWARSALAVDATFRADRLATAGPAGTTAQPESAGPAHKARTIADAHHSTGLPGTVVRTEGQGPTGDTASDEAYDGLGWTFDLYWDVFSRNSIDDHGSALLGTVHYGDHYDNAFYNGTQMVFGDGDGTLFNRFTIAVDVMGHELTHGVTAHEAGLVYSGQPGALNESVSDVFGSLVKQFSLGQTAAQADWLIGAGLLAAGVHGVALRSMSAPGTAYDDPALGKDPQPADMAHYVHTSSDNGGVHINSGIPNRAFYLVAVALGGHAWERAGQIWYRTLCDSRLSANADFQAFADLTATVAAELYGGGVRQAVVAAWAAVGIVVASPAPAWSGWASEGGVLTSAIAVGSNADGRLEAFVRGTDNALWHTWQTTPNGGWSGWLSSGGVLTSDPTVARNADGRLEAFVRGTDGALWHTWQTSPNGTWSGWASEGGVLTSDVAVGRNQDGRLEAFVRGTDNALWHIWQTSPNGTWSGWASEGGVLDGEITVGANADGRLEVFVRGTDGAMWHTWQTTPNGTWSGWASEGGVLTSGIALGSNADGRLEAFVRGTDNALWHTWQTTPNGTWSGWASEGGVLTSQISVGRNAGGRLEAFVRGTDNALWHTWQVAPNGSWSGWATEGGVLTSDPVVASNADGRLEVFVRGTDNALWHLWQNAPMLTGPTGGGAAAGSMPLGAMAAAAALPYPRESEPAAGVPADR